MVKLYEENTANYPRLETDVFFVDYENKYKYKGFMDKAFNFVENRQLLNVELWKRFVQQFIEDADSLTKGWRGEYWGKMMRGACFVYSYTQNSILYEILENTVKDLVATQDDEGRIASFDKESEFDGWDIWSRKYVFLGMQYFLEICEDKELEKNIISSMKKQLDYIMSKIGRSEDGKIPITSATRHWRGLNSASILEPVVRLYSLTKEQKYFDYATYIVETGGMDLANIFDYAYENDFPLYLYPATKAYEMTSCFEGLLEYYRITKNERYKTALINYANRILEDDFTVIGSCGCTHELFDHSTVRQANTTNHYVMQETCVTVTIMKFFYQMLLLTGDAKYADAFEISLYNAYLGAFNTENVIEPYMIKEHSDLVLEPLPFVSYSPLTAQTKGNLIGGMQIMSDKHYYGCCACIGSAGIGLVPKMHILTTESGFTVNLFVDGEVETKTPTGNAFTFTTKTDYPKSGNILIEVDPAKSEKLKILIRNPYWSKTTEVLVNGERINVNAGYIPIEREWKKGDKIEINLDMRCEPIYPIPYGEQFIMTKTVWINELFSTLSYDKEDPLAKNHIALRRGPVMLAQDNRLGYSVDDAVDVLVNEEGYVDITLTDAPYDNIIAVNVPLENGETMLTTDYSSAGKLYTEESKMAVWILTNKQK